MKKLISILLSLISFICVSFAFIGCDCGQKSKGKFYSLEQAYDNGLLTIDELKSIAQIYNGESKCTQTLDSQTELLIKSCIVDKLKNEDKIAEAKIEDTEIVAFYGKYSDCFIVTYDSIYFAYNTDVVNEWFYVGGIAFHKTDHLGITAWVKI